MIGFEKGTAFAAEKCR